MQEIYEIQNKYQKWMIWFSWSLPIIISGTSTVLSNASPSCDCTDKISGKFLKLLLVFASSSANRLFTFIMLWLILCSYQAFVYWWINYVWEPLTKKICFIHPNSMNKMFQKRFFILNTEEEMLNMVEKEKRWKTKLDSFKQIWGWICFKGKFLPNRGLQIRRRSYS